MGSRTFVDRHCYYFADGSRAAVRDYCFSYCYKEMNPEREYGKALGILEERRRVLTDAVIRSNIERADVTTKEYKELFDISEAVRIAWEARQVLRRKCGMCKIYHDNVPEDSRLAWCDNAVRFVTDRSKKAVNCPVFKLRPAPMPTALQARMAGEMVDDGKEAQS